MKNEYTFDELQMHDLFESVIKEAFKNDESQEKDYWYKLFGDRDIKIYDSLQIDEPQFPCVVIRFTAVPYKRNIHSSEIEQFSAVSVDIEHFNQRVGDVSKDRLGLMINYRLKNILQKTFGLLIVGNRPLINAYDSSIYRRLIEGRFVYDNKNKVFYRD